MPSSVCKSRIASQELKKKSIRQFIQIESGFSRLLMNERFFGLVTLTFKVVWSCWPKTKLCTFDTQSFLLALADVTKCGYSGFSGYNGFSVSTPTECEFTVSTFRRSGYTESTVSTFSHPGPS
jgi:hypothetical protein